MFSEEKVREFGWRNLFRLACQDILRGLVLDCEP